MSRVGLKPIQLPEKVSIKIDGQKVSVDGPKGSLSVEMPDCVSAVEEDGQVVVKRATEHRRHRALLQHGYDVRILSGGMQTWATFARDAD
jgi:large subunit ribosomal protein L6